MRRPKQTVAAVLALLVVAPQAWAGVPSDLPSAKVAQYEWSLVALQQPPPTMHPGQKTVITAVLRNNGSAIWQSEQGANPMRLAAVNALGVQPRERSSAFGREDPTWIGPAGKRIRMTTPSVPPGAVGSFSFTFTAPTAASYPQNHVERFAPIAEGIALLDSALLLLSTQVRPSASALPAIPETPPIAAPTLPAIPGPTCSSSITPDSAPTGVEEGFASDGFLLSGKIAAPAGVAYGFGKVLAADTAGNRIAKSDPAGFATEFFGASGSGPGQFNGPSGIAISDSGLIFVADTGNHRIQVFGFAGVFVSQFGSQGDLAGQFRSPTGISMIANGPLAGNLVVADTGNDRVQIVSRVGDPISTIGVAGDAAGQLSSPVAASVWGEYVFVADTGNERVQRFKLDGTPAGGWGGAGSDAGCTGVATGILANRSGVIVTEFANARVEKFTHFGAHLETFGQLNQPLSAALDPSGRLYVAESGANRIARFKPALAASPPVP